MQNKIPPFYIDHLNLNYLFSYLFFLFIYLFFCKVTLSIMKSAI